VYQVAAAHDEQRQRDRVLDGRPSANRIIPVLQQLTVGDQIPMLPAMGVRVRTIQPNQYLVAGDDEAGSGAWRCTRPREAAAWSAAGG
jgi:hypothetical protein